MVVPVADPNTWARFFLSIFPLRTPLSVSLMSSVAPKSTPLLVDRARLDAVLEPIAKAHGAEVFDVEFKSEPAGWVLRIYVEKLGSSAGKASTRDAAIDLELCSQVARELSPALDVADVIPHRYHLEVSSPGVERPLKRRQDFERFHGEKAKLRLNTAVHGQKVLVGKIAAVEEAADEVMLAIEDGSRTFKTPLSNVSAARLVFEFGPQPKPGKKKK